MRTTLSIDDKLLRKAKILAAKTGITLSAMIEDAVRERLLRSGNTPSGSYKPPMILPQDGGLRPGIDINNNAQLSEMMDEWDATDRRQRPDQRSA